ncbi:MAG: hypothetical protein Q7S81_01315 [bacterium]|nr:hypothetical protein [bacterium]
MKKIIILTLGLALFLPVLASATIGVGIGTGKIVMGQPLMAGQIHTLPVLVVLNTGDESSKYGVSTISREDQPEFKPSKEWFGFEPSEFNLEPGQSQIVQIKLTLPIKGAKPGDYFVFLQARPVSAVVSKGTSIGVAAAAKLYFTVAPANIFQGIYYRFIDLYSNYHPWDTIVLAIIFSAIILRSLGKRFKFQIAKR